MTRKRVLRTAGTLILWALLSCGLRGQSINRVLVDGDSLSSSCCPPTPAWPLLLDTKEFTVIDNAISGGAVLYYPGCPHVITETYGPWDKTNSPVKTGTNSFFVLFGEHNDLYAGRHTVADTFNATTNILEWAREDGFIRVMVTLPPSQQLNSTGAEGAREEFNDMVYAATNAYDILIDLNNVLSQNTSDTNSYFDGTHFGPVSTALAAAEFTRQAQTFIATRAGRVSLSQNGSTMCITWSGYQMLQNAPAAAGPFTNAGALVGPYTDDGSSPAKFFRLLRYP